MKSRLTFPYTRGPNALTCFAQTALLCLLQAASSRAAQITWTNLTGGDWNSAANWSPNQAPGAADDAMIAVPVGVTLAGSNSVLSLALSGNSTLIAQGTNASAQVGGLWVGAGVTLNASNVTVEAGSAITANGQGYTTGAGPGGTSAGNYFAGGSYGGKGSDGSGPTYGNFAAPTDLGSAGGGMYGGYSLGGGGIALHLTGSLVLDGAISANGQSAGGNNAGAAGGSVYIITGTLTGSGAITADGNQGSNAQGGGGRIAVYYADASGYAAFTNCTANGSQPGTVGFFDTSLPNSKLSVFANMVFPQDSSLHYGGMAMANGATATLGGGSTLQVDGNLSLSNSATIFAVAKNVSAQVSGQWAGEGVTINAGDVTMEAGSVLSADGQGYTTGAGPGAASSGNYSAGGSYGGRGQGGSGPTYGNAMVPVDLGSAGGAMYGGYSAGGGAIALHVGGSVVLDGTISANGRSAGGNNGGGAGGSVYITTGTLAGSGAISANGNQGSNAQGGGGRVAICWRQTLTFSTNNISVSPGGSGAEPGSLVINTQAGACGASAPQITIQPTNQTAQCGSNAIFSVTATNAGSLGYQWYLFGTNALNGATNASLLLSNVSLSTSGEAYSVIVTNSSGSATSQVATLTVQDTIPPVVTLNGSAAMTIECHSSFTDPGATAFDTCAGSLPVTTNGTVNPNQPGTNVLAYTATDPSGNSATNTRTVIVVDTTPPVITLLGANPLTNECHTPFVDPGATATDTCAGSLSVLTNSTVNPNAVGSYTISYTSTDPSANSATNTRTVIVVDTTPPVVTMLGADPLTNECHTPFVDPGATAADTCAGSLSVSTNSTVNPNAVGSYTISYTSTDPSGNSATNNRTVMVVDTTPPSITCSTNILLECTGAAGTPAFFITTATDTCDANPTIVCTPPSGSLFALGTNTVICVATDASGNSNLCSFTVTVRDTTPPQIVCPTNMNVAEAPRDSGFATVTFPSPIATDLCDSSPSVFSTPPSGSVLPVATNTITCTAVDSSGNSNSCTFTIRVIPYRLHVTVSSVADSGPGTLRQALHDANDSPDANLVVFNFPGPAPYTIHLLSALPAVTSPVIIDGWSQPGFSGTPVVELDGSTASNAIDGLVILSGPSTVRGLAVHGFATAIRLTSAGTNIVQGNYIGTDTTGTNAPGNMRDGIYLNSQRNLIGGAAPGVGNVICSNAGNGIVFDTSGATRNAVQGNFIGTAADGISPLGNGQNGIYFTNQPFRNLVGAITNGAANTIAFNGRTGISLDTSAGVGNQFFGNAIFSNTALGIDLGDDGVTTNHAGGSLPGPNGFQNFPVLTDATSVSGVLTIYGQITSTANTTFRIDFFLNDAADPSGYGEGQVFLGSAFVGTHGDGNGSFTVAFPVAATYTQFVTATATGPGDGTSEFSAAVQVRTPPSITLQPTATNAPIGSSATFCAQAAGTPPFFYQWRLNGFNIPGATNACYTVSAADVTNGGSYTVIVANNLGALGTEQAALTLPITNLSGADYFSNRVTLQGVSGVVAGQNVGATSEPGEPMHAGKPGGKSVWYTWQAPVTGVATFTTRGSTFNTLLAVYTGSAFSNLVAVASDVDHGGFYTSQARFNGIKGKQYQIAIDGFGGADGQYVLDWSQIDDPHLLPVFTSQPQSQTVAPGDDATFVAVAQRVCGLGHLNCPVPSHYPTGTLPGLTYQWYFFDAPITGADSNILTVPNVQSSDVGTYTLKVWTFGQVNNGQIDFGQTNQSDDAILQINLTGSGTEQVQAFDQLLDSEDDPNVLVIGGVVGSSTQSGSGPHPLAASTVVSGFTGSQIFNTAGSGTGPGEVICGVIGGSSDWLTFLPATSGTLFLNTDGSTYDTVMAVFKRNPTNSAALDLITCDNNSGTNGKTSAVVFPVQAGVTNYVVVDGINGATGILLLNYYLVTAATVQLLAPTPEKMQHVQVIGRTNMHFILQASTNFSAWTSLLTTSSPTAIFDYIDPTSTNLPQRYYRALLLP